VVLTWPVGAIAACKVARTPDLPITMQGLRPTITAQINGVDAQFALDSGAFYSMISGAAAAQFNLPLQPLPPGYRVNVIGGTIEVKLTRVKVFTFAGVPIRNVEFLVGGSEVGQGSAGILGQNFLELFDVEYDLGHGAIRLATAEDCKHVMMAYWAAGASVSSMEISRTSPEDPHTVGTAYINDTKIRVVFDTGAATSMISLKAAARAGVTPATPGVTDGGYQRNFGHGSVKTYIAPFASFKIGDNEEIKNARLRIADTVLPMGDMLIGADFFLSHRLYVANSQHRLYFTYNGGPVFNLAQSAAAGAGADEQAAAGGGGDQAADAGALFRQGAASAGRGDVRHAIQDFTKAIDIDANEPEYFHQRAVAYWQDKQMESASADLDHALKLDPNYLPALVTRAELRMAKRDLPGTAADLDSADRIAPKQADIRYTMARLYIGAALPAAAIAQYDLWIANHPDDSKMPTALSGRCESRALNGSDLAKALDDCNSGLRRMNKTDRAYGGALISRGLVQLRLGAFDKSIADFDASATLQPKNPWPLYGRGIAKSKLNKVSEAEADKAAATALLPHIGETFARYGIGQ
jgi:tetratricopeptide (TPR) repeat protein